MFNSKKKVTNPLKRLKTNERYTIITELNTILDSVK